MEVLCYMWTPRFGCLPPQLLKSATINLEDPWKKSLIPVEEEWLLFLICKYPKFWCYVLLLLFYYCTFRYFVYMFEWSEWTFRFWYAQKLYLLQNAEAICCKHFMYSWMNKCIVYIDPILLADSTFSLFKPQVSESIIQKCHMKDDGLLNFQNAFHM